MKNSYRNNGDLGEEILDKITDAMESLDTEGMIQNIRNSVDFIQKEAEKGYSSLQNASDLYRTRNNGKASGADQSWFTGNNAQRADASGTYSERGSYQYSEGAHKASSGQYSYQYNASSNGPHRASSGQYTRDHFAGGQTQHNQAAGNTGKKRKMLPVIQRFPGEVSGILEICTGGVGMAAWMGFAFAAMIGGPSVGYLIFLGILLAVDSGLLWNGIGRLRRINRLRKYNKLLMGKDYCMIQDLAVASGQSKTQVLKDMKLLLENKCMPGVTLDKEETCLMLTKEARKQYEDAEYAKIQRELEEAQKKAMEEAEALKKASATKEEKAWMQFDEDYTAFYKDLDEIRKDMDTPVMKEHVEKVDALLKKVYDCVKEHKEMIGRTGHLTSYYFPCMSKLFHTYLDLEEQPIQGDNILKTKAEIENSFDTIEKALTNMYDEMFTELSMDISSDIQVLKAMMARDGLAENQMKAESGGITLEQGNVRIPGGDGQPNVTAHAAAADRADGAGAVSAAMTDTPDHNGSSAFADDLKKAEAAAAKAAEDAMKSGGTVSWGQSAQAGAFAVMPEKESEG